VYINAFFASFIVPFIHTRGTLHLNKSTSLDDDVITGLREVRIFLGESRFTIRVPPRGEGRANYSYSRFTDPTLLKLSLAVDRLEYINTDLISLLKGRACSPHDRSMIVENKQRSKSSFGWVTKNLPSRYPPSFES
jgi:hypothetical protein